MYVACCVLEKWVKPPERYPYIFPLVYAMMGYYFYMFMLCYSNILLTKYTMKQLRKRKCD